MADLGPVAWPPAPIRTERLVLRVGGFSFIDVPSREAALEWAAKFAVACRCG